MWPGVRPWVSASSPGPSITCPAGPLTAHPLRTSAHPLHASAHPLRASAYLQLHTGALLSSPALFGIDNLLLDHLLSDVVLEITPGSNPRGPLTSFRSWGGLASSPACPPLECSPQQRIYCHPSADSIGGSCITKWEGCGF